MANAAAATRAYGTVTLSIDTFVEIRLALWSRVNKYGFSRSRYNADTGNKVKQLNVDAVSGQPVQNIVMKVETEKGAVYVSDDEIEALFDIKPDSLVVRAYQPRSVWLSGAYIPKVALDVEVALEKKGTKKVRNQAAEGALAALLRVMEQDDVVAVCELTTRGKPQPCVLLPNGTLWIVCHDEEVRESRPKPEVDLDDETVQEFREAFWNPTVVTEPLDLSDVRTNTLYDFAEKKAEKGDFGEPEAGQVTVVEPTSTPATSLKELLRAKKAQQEAVSA